MKHKGKTLAVVGKKLPFYINPLSRLFMIMVLKLKLQKSPNKNGLRSGRLRGEKK